MQLLRTALLCLGLFTFSIQAYAGGSAPPKPTGGSNQPADVPRAKRALLVLSELSTYGSPKWLYRFIEDSGAILPIVYLLPVYGDIRIMLGNNATYSSFKNCLNLTVRDSRFDRIDTHIHVHGSPGRNYFKDGIVASSTIASDLNQMNASTKGMALTKLRALYSTACYGETMNSAYNSVFSVSSGARKINTNSSIEYPSFLLKWAVGSSYRDAISLGLVQQGLSVASDSVAALLLGRARSEVDSYKLIQGNQEIRIHNPL